jgi:hypothetical protein
VEHPEKNLDETQMSYGLNTNFEYKLKNDKQYQYKMYTIIKGLIILRC